MACVLKRTRGIKMKGTYFDGSNSVKRVRSLIKSGIPYREEGNIIHFIADENDRPEWSKALENSLTAGKTDLKMSRRYKNQRRIMTEDGKRRRFVDFISAADGVKVDLASGPSGYFSPMLDTLKETDLFIATDACPTVLRAHSQTCPKDNYFVFDVDLDRELPFRDESIAAFSGNLLNNVEHYAALIQEAYRCLEPGGRFAVIELFFESGCRTFEYLRSSGAVWSSFDTYVSFCESVGFRYMDSAVLQARTGKIAEDDLLPLDENDRSEERTVYFQK